MSYDQMTMVECRSYDEWLDCRKMTSFGGRGVIARTEYSFDFDGMEEFGLCDVLFVFAGEVACGSKGN